MLALTLLIVGLVAAPAVAEDPPAKIVDKSEFANEVARLCDQAEGNLRKAVAAGELSLKPADVQALCQAKTPKECWTALRAKFLKTGDEKVDSQLGSLRSQLLSRTVDIDDRLERVTRAAQGHADRVETAVAAALAKLVPVDKEVDPVVLADAVAKANSELLKARDALPAEFSEACDASSPGVIASFHSPSEGLTLEAENALYRSLTSQKENFSRQVRCGLKEVGQGPDDRNLTLTCEPGLLLSGEEISEISIMVEGPPLWVTRAQAVTSEELRPRGGFEEIHSCASALPKHELTCDVIAIGKKVSAIPVAVHKARRIRPTYGCGTRNLECALQVLRPNEPRDRLTLALTAAAPSIHVIVEDIQGRIAAARIPMGYARWKIEMGGFFAVTPLTDKQLLTESFTETVDDQSVTRTRVVGFLDKEDWGQETGIYTNFIPSNYEFFGIGLGFATRTGKSPSVYLGPNLRLRSFGGKGLASLGTGVVMRSVDRFPELKVGDTFEPDSMRLVPVAQHEFDCFIAFNLGFRFGPVGIDSDDE